MSSRFRNPMQAHERRIEAMEQNDMTTKNSIKAALDYPPPAGDDFFHYMSGGAISTNSAVPASDPTPNGIVVAALTPEDAERAAATIRPGGLDIVEARRLAGVRFRAWTCIDHDGVWPVASVVVAMNEDEARTMLTAALADLGFSGEGFTLQELNLLEPGVRILSNGEY